MHQQQQQQQKQQSRRVLQGQPSNAEDMQLLPTKAGCCRLLWSCLSSTCFWKALIAKMI
jgi:hypothetical protein